MGQILDSKQNFPETRVKTKADTATTLDRLRLGDKISRKQGKTRLDWTVWWHNQPEMDKDGTGCEYERDQCWVQIRIKTKLPGSKGKARNGHGDNSRHECSAKRE
jgi:hypothetical protein